MWKRLWTFFEPSPPALVFVWIGLALFLISTLSTYFVFSADPTIPKIPMLSLVPLPMLSLLLGLACLRERHSGGRLLLWSGVVLCAVIGVINILVFSWRGAGSAASRDSLTAFWRFPGGPAFGFVWVIWAFLIWRTWPTIRTVMEDLRLQRLITLVAARGEAALADIAAALSLSEPWAQTLLLGLIDSRRLMASYDPEYRRVYSAAALNEKQRRLAGIITAQGKVKLEALGGELRVSRGLITHWIYALARQGRLHGFADWAEGWVYSFPPGLGENAEITACPHCGGALDVAGKGVIECSYCKVEVFR